MSLNKGEQSKNLLYINKKGKHIDASLKHQGEKNKCAVSLDYYPNLCLTKQNKLLITNTFGHSTIYVAAVIALR